MSAEIDSQRCAELRAELGAEQDQCSYDELRVIRVFVRRVALGRERHGYMDLERDRRDHKLERAEEYIDAAVYDACDYLDRADREGRRGW